MNEGWIKLYRKLQDKGYYKNSKYVHLWIHILIKANHKGKEFMFNKEIIKIKPGQFLTGRKKLSEETNINSSNIENILNLFEKEQQIEQQKTNKFRIISVTNWEDYQYITTKQQQSNNKITTSEHKQECNKNDKNKYTTKQFYEKQKELAKGKYRNEYIRLIDFLNGENDMNKSLDVVLNLRDQLTFEQFEKLRNNLKEINRGRENHIKITEKLMVMYNQPKYLKGKKSLYLTLLNWIKPKDQR